MYLTIRYLVYLKSGSGVSRAGAGLWVGRDH